MRLMLFILAGCLACDSGRHKAVVAPPPAAPSSPGAIDAAAASGAPNTPPSAPSAGSRASDSRSEGQPGCRFERPAVWAGGQVAWLGACRNGFADGSGVLINVVEGAEPERFYGQLDSGFQSIGVLQTESGFVAGRWNHGRVAAALPDDVAQRNVIIDSFRVAASAANAVSKSFAKKSDAPASGFYAQQARLLREQMD